MVGISVAVFVIGFMIFISVFTAAAGKVPSLLGYSVLQVQTGSMEPTLKVGDVIIVKKVDTDTLKIGDIISFYCAGESEIEGKVNTHRIVERVEAATGGYLFGTKGDANDEVDKYKVYDQRVIGRFVYDIGSVGSSAVSVLRNPKIIFIFIILPLIIICFSEAYTLITMIVTNKIAKQQEDDDDAEFNQDKKN